MVIRWTARQRSGIPSRMNDSIGSRAKRAWEWYLSDSGRRLFVGAVWAALVAITFSYVVEYARNWPVNDEWAFVGDFIGGDRQRTEWIFDRHAEHRYPFARAILVSIDEVCGHDYRIAIGVHAALLAAASGFLILAARRLRGTTEYTDCLFPALLLHRGHCEDLLMGYQIAFGLSVFCVAALVLALSGARPRLWSAALAVVGLAGGGGAGILYAIPLGAVLLGILVRERRGIAPGLLALVAVFAAGWQIADQLRKPPLNPHNGAAKTAEVFLQAADGAFGRAVDDDFPSFGISIGVIVIAAAVLAAGSLARAVRREPAVHRPLGLLAVLAGTFGFLLAIGSVRTNGYAYRFSSFSQFAVIVPWLWTTRFPGRRRWQVVVGAMVTAIAATAIVRQNWGVGTQYGDRYAAAYEAAEADARRGIPIDILAERNIYYFPSPDSNARPWGLLREAGIAPFSATPAPGAGWRTQPGTLDGEPGGTRWKIGPEGAPPARALRIRGSCPRMAEWARMRFTWTDIASDGTESPHPESRGAWRAGGAWATVLWFDCRIRDLVFESDGDDRPESAEWLFDPEGSDRKSP